MPIKTLGKAAPVLAPIAAAVLVLALLAAWVLGGGFGTIARERIEVLGARIPLPSTPGITAAYLTMRDTGAQADELLSVATTSAQQAMLMTDQQSTGSGVMQRVTGIAIPAHGSVALGPYADDVMLQGTGTLHEGQSVTLTLTFRGIGTVTVAARVVPPGTP